VNECVRVQEDSEQGPNQVQKQTHDRILLSHGRTHHLQNGWIYCGGQRFDFNGKTIEIVFDPVFHEAFALEPSI
jgi:hypothetical protein